MGSVGFDHDRVPDALTPLKRAASYQRAPAKNWLGSFGPVLIDGRPSALT
jgi:hypothetical protein